MADVKHAPRGCALLGARPQHTAADARRVRREASPRRSRGRAANTSGRTHREGARATLPSQRRRSLLEPARARSGERPRRPRSGRRAHTRIACTRAPRRVEAPLEEACSQAEPGSASCVQRFDDSLNSAIRTTYRISLRSSSLREPRYPSTRVV